MNFSNNFIPFFLDITNKKVLVIGGGEIAYRKIKTLLTYGANITVITKEIKSLELVKLKNIKILFHEFADLKEAIEDELENFSLKSYFLVIAASDVEFLNSRISYCCMKNNILVNNITSKDYMNCRFSSIYENEECIIGISGKGNPKLSKKIKEKLKMILG